MRDAEIAFSWPWLAASIGLLAAFLWTGAVLWHYLTRTMGTAIPIRAATAAWFYSQLGKYAPGKIFIYLARLYFYAKEGRAVGPVTLAVGLEVGASVVATMLVVLVAAGTLALDGGGWKILGLAVTAGGLLAMLHPSVLRAVVRTASRTLRRPEFPVTISYGQLLRLVGLHFANWVVFAAAFYAFIRSFYPLPADAILFVSGAFALATLAGMAAVFVPAGLGVREGLLAVFLSRVMPEPLAVVGAIAARAWFTAVELACVGVVSLFAGARRRPTAAQLEQLRETALPPDVSGDGARPKGAA